MRPAAPPSTVWPTGVILRRGDQWRYHSLPWHSNAWYGTSPDLWADDFNGDGRPEAAVALHAGHGTGVNLHQLYLFSLDSLEPLTPDYDRFFSSLQVSLNEETQTVTLTGHRPEWTDARWTVDLTGTPWEGRFSGLSLSGIVFFTREGKTLQAHFGADFSDMTLGYLGELTADVVWENGVYTLTNPSFSLYNS